MTRERWKILATIAAGMLAFEILLVGMMAFSGPKGTRWLGDTMQNASDVAVYLSEIRQGADGNVLLKNLFAVEPHAARFDVVWSVLGLIARNGIPPFVVHESARILFTLALAAALLSAARSVSESERDARLATLLAFGGVGTGWLYSLWLGANGLWKPMTYAAADVVTEFGVSPTLIGGAHMILSLALLLTALRLIWTAAAERSTRRLCIGATAAGTLLLFHPYFGPLLAVYALVSFVTNRKALGLRHAAAFVGILTVGAIPAIVVYLPLAFDPVFRSHHLSANVLPLAPWPAWIATLLPFGLAFAWRWKRGLQIRADEQWILAWLLAAAVCMALPFPWTRKYTEGLGVALVLLTLPAWFALRNWALRGVVGLQRVAVGTALLLAVFLTPLHILASHAVWASNPSTQSWFYQTDGVFRAWDYLRMQTASSAVVISDDRWINLWTPAYAGRTVWVAHDHETPDFAAKRAAWKRLLATDDSLEAESILARAGVTHFLTTTPESSARFRHILNGVWTEVWTEEGFSLFVQLVSRVADFTPSTPPS